MKFSPRPVKTPSMRMRVSRVGMSRIVAPVPDAIHSGGGGGGGATAVSATAVGANGDDLSLPQETRNNTCIKSDRLRFIGGVSPHLLPDASTGHRASLDYTSANPIRARFVLICPSGCRPGCRRAAAVHRASKATRVLARPSPASRVLFHTAPPPHLVAPPPTPLHSQKTAVDNGHHAYILSP